MDTAERGSGRISYLVVRNGSNGAIGERLYALSWKNVAMDQEQIRLVGIGGFEDLAEIDPAHWPACPSPMR